MRLSIQDRRHIEASEGWLGLGNWTEANHELDHVTAALRDHPDVLRLRFEVCTAAKNFELATEIASALCKQRPGDPEPCLLLGRALHGKQTTEVAVNFLTEAAKEFPNDHRIPLDLARYHCALNDVVRAAAWLKRAIEISDTKEVKLAALDDPLLLPLWDQIGQVPLAR
ncbi:MAG TPA: tetratricopeptide repeat protein [Candidatus Dormibacteraeota bacterium]|nr:tetratricopeptide repeat protein [Candidatus Dormibacteraeota bacterium]